MKIINNNISFKSNLRRYYLPNGKRIKTTTFPFREGVDWNQLAQYEKDHFKNKNKVNIVQFAASDGSEAYTKIISLLEANAEDKFFPIKAYDLDSEMVRAARSGLLNLYKVDLINLSRKVSDYHKYFGDSDKKLNILNEKKLSTQRTLEVKDILRKRVEFNFGDMFKIIKELKDDSNTILLCRNILGYFEPEKISSFIKTVSEKLKSGSLFVIGNFDAKYSPVREILNKNKFQEVMQNVFKKI